MIIDSLTDKSSINIDKLTIPDVKTEFYPTFDPETDVTQEDLIAGIDDFLRNRDTVFMLERRAGTAIARSSLLNDLERLGDLAVALKFFSSVEEPKRSLDHSLFAIYRDLISNSIVTYRRLDLVAQAKFLFPGFISELPEVGDPDFRLDVMARLRDGLAWKEWDMFPEMAVRARQCFSDPREIPNLTPDYWVGIRKTIEKGWTGTWLTVEKSAHLAAMVKLAFPEKSAELGLDREIWEKMRKNLADGRERKYWRRFFTLAYAMAILAADEAKITDGGEIEIVMPKVKNSVEEKIPDMPVKRAF